jgi:hypothetical protein
VPGKQRQNACSPRARSNRNGGRDQIGILGDLKSESLGEIIGIRTRPKSKIPKRKKATSSTPLSSKIEYYIKTNSAYFSDRSVFFTDDYEARHFSIGVYR